jgi:integral membrane sensor domain MASE1
VACGLSAGYLASVTFATTMPDGAGLWTAAGFLTGIFLLTGGWVRWAAAGACLVAHPLIVFGHGDGPVKALVFPLINLIEASLAAYLAVTFCGARSRRLSLRSLILILLGAILPSAAVGGIVGGLATMAPGHGGFLAAWRDWSIPVSLGMAIVVPALLLVARARQYRDFRRTPAETVGLLAGLAVLTAVVDGQSDFPVYFAVFPALTLVAFRLGPAGAAVAGFLVGVIALPMAAFQHGPSMLVTHLDLNGRMRLTQFFVAAALFTGLGTAGALADQARLRRLAFSRDRAARAARARAREAEELAALVRPLRAVKAERSAVRSA